MYVCVPRSFKLPILFLSSCLEPFSFTRKRTDGRPTLSLCLSGVLTRHTGSQIRIDLLFVLFT